MTNQVRRLSWNLYSVWGLRGLNKRYWALIVFNRITRRLFSKVLCHCGRLVYWSTVWSVCCNDTFICNECMKNATNGEYDNEE